MTKEKIKKILIVIFLVYILTVISFYFLAYDQIKADAFFGASYWYLFGFLGLFLLLVLLISYKRFIRGSSNYLLVLIYSISNYRFLISQLVSRDFKSKYKRSLLGIVWSFLNPLLTMAVQFFVFSTLFSNGNVNYPAYLLIGTVMFNFFNEASSMCLSSITGNANLINKVYVPKYIYPLTRVMSSLINMAITLLPTAIVCILCGIKFYNSTLLFLYFLICLIIFTLGIGLLLSAITVFFRDVQFLWTVFLQMWLYATPIFYPAEIIPNKFSFILKLNPLYHLIGNARQCIIFGTSPEISVYLFCAMFALVSLFVGLFVFKKTQDKFSLYL